MFGNASENSLIISQFDTEYKEQIAFMQKNTENVMENMLNSLEFTLLSLPTAIRQMKLKDLIEIHNGDLNHALSFPHQTQYSRPISLSKTPNFKEPLVRSNHEINIKHGTKAKTPK